jgi:hypothetical protein
VVMLDMALFLEQKSANAEKIVRYEETNWQGSVDDSLRDFQWTRRALACIGLTLMADNRMVHQGYLDTRGTLTPGARWRQESQESLAGLDGQLNPYHQAKDGGRGSVPRRWVVFGLRL